MILNIIQISLRLTKKQVPAHFRCTKFWKLDFRFSFTASKDAEFNFRGSHKGDFQDRKMFCASTIDFRALWSKMTSSFEPTDLLIIRNNSSLLTFPSPSLASILKARRFEGLQKCLSIFCVVWFNRQHLVSISFPRMYPLPSFWNLKIQVINVFDRLRSIKLDKTRLVKVRRFI